MGVNGMGGGGEETVLKIEGKKIVVRLGLPPKKNYFSEVKFCRKEMVQRNGIIEIYFA
jgi:hypothetical protein